MAIVPELHDFVTCGSGTSYFSTPPKISQTDAPTDYGTLIRNNSEFRKDLYKRLRSEALRVIADIRSMSPRDRNRMFGDFGDILVDIDTDTLDRFATQLRTIEIGKRIGEAAEQGLFRGLGKAARRAWNIITGSQRAYERSQYGPKDIEGWIGACNPLGVDSAGHCGFYDPNIVFRDIDEMVPPIMQGHGGPP